MPDKIGPIPECEMVHIKSRAMSAETGQSFWCLALVLSIRAGKLRENASIWNNFCFPYESLAPKRALRPKGFNPAAVVQKVGAGSRCPRNLARRLRFWAVAAR